MKSYVVRIYRRGPENRSQITGVVEPAENGQDKVFHNLMELWAILASDDREDTETRQETGDMPDSNKIDFLVQL